MTRHPVSFICPVPISRTKCPDTERFFVRDLGVYLRVPAKELTIFARKKGIAKWARLVRRRYCETEVCWVTRTGARLILEHFRALQGKAALAGKDWYAQRKKAGEAWRKHELRKRAATAAGP